MYCQANCQLWMFALHPLCGPSVSAPQPCHESELVRSSLEAPGLHLPRSPTAMPPIQTTSMYHQHRQQACNHVHCLHDLIVAHSSSDSARGVPIISKCNQMHIISDNTNSKYCTDVLCCLHIGLLLDCY